MSENRPGALVHFGQDAIDRMLCCFNSYMQDDALGNAYCVRRGLKRDLRMFEMTTHRREEIVAALFSPARFSELESYEMIVIDSGNVHGDSWIATFYPRQRVMTFVDQTFRHEGPRQCMSCAGSEDAGFRGGQCGACAGHSEDNAALPSKEEVQRNQLECSITMPALPVLETRYNNAAVKSTCPVCHDVFKPSIGDWDFLAGTLHPVCETCSEKIQEAEAEDVPF